MPQSQDQGGNPLFGDLVAKVERSRVKRRLTAVLRRKPKPARVRQQRDDFGQKV